MSGILRQVEYLPRERPSRAKSGARRGTRARGRRRWVIPALVVGVAVGAVLPLTASAHDTPTLPLTETIVNGLIAGAGCNTAINENTTLPSPDRKVGGSNNLYIGGAGQDRDGTADIGPIALWANADSDPKELTLDVSGQHNVIDGDAVSRSHLKVSASQSLFRHATEYGLRSASGKNAFDMSGQNNCFNLEPDLVPRDSPTAPDGFPFEEQFDPDGNGNVLEHFDTFAEVLAKKPGMPASEYRVCKVGSSSNISPPMICDTGSGKLTGDVQGTNIPQGVYFVEGEVLISASNQFAKVTIVSGKQLKVNGSVQGEGANVFSPYIPDLLFASQWDTANNTANTDKAEDALKIEGSKSQFQGIIVATEGRTELAGEQNIFTCPVMGDRVRLNGSKLYISGHACGRPGLTIEKTPDGIDGTIPDGVINAGDLAVFTIKVTNSGSSPANNVVVTDTLPGTGWTENPDTLCTITGGNALECLVGTLAAGASFTVTVQRTTTTADCQGDTGSGVTLHNGSDTPGDPAGDALANATGVPQANDPGSIIVKCPDAGVAKTPDNGTVNAGSPAVFDIVVTANGPGTSFNVNLTDNLPNSGLNWSITAGADQPPAGPPNSCQIAGAVGSQVLTCSFGDIPFGQTRTVQVSSPTDVADCAKGLITNPVSITGDGDTLSGNNSDTGSLTVICGAIRIFKDSTKGGRVNNAGAVFSVDGPDAGDTPDFSVTDDLTAAEPDEDSDVGEICVDGLQIGATYTVNETSPPTGYGGASQTNVAVVAVAGSCPTGAFNNATFTNPPLADLQVRFRDGGSTEAVLDSPLDCNNVTGTESAADTAGWDDTLTIEDIQVTAATITVVCTIVIDP